MSNFVAAQRAMIDRLLKSPAEAAGRPRWGAKEVVWDSDCVKVLNLLYPDARFVVILRDPVDQWRSYRPETRRAWYWRWPHEPIRNVHSFARMWERLAVQFAALDAAMPNLLVVKYETLTEPDTMSSISQHLHLDRELRTDLPRVGSSRGGKFYTEVPRHETAALRVLTRRGRSRYGYP